MADVPLTIDRCRSCGGALMELFDLGEHVPVSFPKPEERVRDAVPIFVVRCRACHLVQLRHTTPRTWLYGEYWYRSGINDVMVAELRDIVEAARARVSFTAEHCHVLDIGANDGTLLRAWADTQAPGAIAPYRIGVEPSALASDALESAELIYRAYFPTLHLHAFAGQLQVITAIAMAYDLPDPNPFFAELHRLLAPQGLIIIQLQDVRHVLATMSVDYFCHEHLECWSLRSLIPVLAHHGLHIVDVEERAINGGSVRVYIEHIDGPHRISERVAPYLRQESKIDTLQHWQTFIERLMVVTTQLQGIVTEAVACGYPVDLYGASTKGLILLGLCGFDQRHIRQAVERSPAKIGRCVGATGIPIVGEAVWRQDPAPLTLVPIWQFRDAVIDREATYLQEGGTFLFPLPVAELYRSGR